MLGYVGYQLWGTGIYTARAQSQLTAEIRTHGFPLRPVPGGALGFIEIPRIDLKMAFVQGIDSAALAKGPGHDPGTPLPGEGGNVLIAGHRTTHLAPFWSIDVLGPGDEITLQTRQGTFLYRVQWMKVVDPTSLWVSGATRRPSLTLTTCNPRFSARERLVIRAVQIYGAIPGGFIDRRSAGSSPLSP
jgi:sortase A